MRLTWTSVGAIVSALGRSPVRATLASLVLVAAIVMPAAAIASPQRLFNPDVSPVNGHPSTQITLSVTYRHSNNAAPDYVRVTVGDDTYDMNGEPGNTNWREGVGLQ